jgi:hypothetical protein
MEKTLKIINELKDKGIIIDYAIGGGIAALFYVEPFLTYDLDIFIIIKEEKKDLISLKDLFEYLKSKGFLFKGEHIIIEGIPVQFIPVNELEKEAVENGRFVKYKSVNTKVIEPEYLIAIFLKIGRRKDIERIEKILNLDIIDRDKLQKILIKFNLLKLWKKRKF